MQFKKHISRRKAIKFSIMATALLFFTTQYKKLFGNGSIYKKNLTPNNNICSFCKEAMFYVPMQYGNVRCQLCPNYCTINSGKSSICRNRENINGKLYSIAYGNPCAVNIDPIEKKPLLHFYPSSTAYSIGTAGCNFSCLNCQNWTISQASPKQTKNYELMPNQVVTNAIEAKCQSIAYTYSEPSTFYEYMYDTCILAKEKGLKNVYISSGYINEIPLRKLAKHLDAANIDLKSFSDDIYKRLNKGRLEPILKTLNILKEENVWLEITNLVIPTWTDDMDMIKKMCIWLVQNGFNNYPLHFSRFMPMYKLNSLRVTPNETLLKAREIALTEGIKYVYIGNVKEINDNTICPSCKKTIIERNGYIVSKNIIKNNKCPFCNTNIAGIWE